MYHPDTLDNAFTVYRVQGLRSNNVSSQVLFSHENNQRMLSSPILRLAGS